MVLEVVLGLQTIHDVDMCELVPEGLKVPTLKHLESSDTCDWLLWMGGGA